MARMKMAARAKKMMEWTKIARPLVLRLTNSTSRPLPGIWNSSPGDSSTKSTTATNTGPQSAISLCLFARARERERERWRKR
ncbi:unnamed protein product [Musa acuminata subsp. malaccensis]|uniref:(wild Malaysian banana) hypothetical protein n=1 Tax=Musa acuminata subsp. malaccensis TaxID=214687 RepID=A0A8D7FIF1_MUSAM|nr:unnamed protein product [Musa acuminata subsp. malaccensis]